MTPDQLKQLAEACGLTEYAAKSGTRYYVKQHLSRTLCKVSDWRPDTNRDHLALVIQACKSRDLTKVIAWNLFETWKDEVFEVDENWSSDTAWVLELFSTDVGVATLAQAAWEVLFLEKK